MSEKEEEHFRGGPGQDSIYLGITDRVVKTGVEREERSEEQTGETSWEYEWETAARYDDERYRRDDDFVSRNDGEVLNSRERRARETVREFVQKLRKWNRGRGAKSVRGSVSVFQ